MSYALDLTASSPANYLTVTVDRPASGAWAFKLPGGSFYTKDLSVKNTFDKKELEPFTQFRALDFNPEASYDSNKEVCDIIFITDNNITQVEVKYRVIGGIYEVIGTDVDNLVKSGSLDATSASAWGQVINAPHQLPPEMHSHYVEDVYGFETATYAIEKIASAIGTGDDGLFGAIFQFIDRKFSLLTTETQKKLDALTESVNSVKDQGKMQKNQVVFFTDNSNPRDVFKYGRWERLPDGLVMMTANNALVGTKKKMGEGTDYIGVYYAAWKYLGD